MNTHLRRGFAVLALYTYPLIAHADVVSSLAGLKTVLISSLLPALAVMALGFAAFQFFVGSPNARQNLTYAIVGSIILYGAQSIVDLISRIVR